MCAMYNVTRVVHFTEAADAIARDEYVNNARHAILAVGVKRLLIAPTLPGVINGGDLIVHLQLTDTASWRNRADDIDSALSQPIADRVDGVEYYPGLGGRGPGQHSSRLYRALLLRVESGTPDSVVQRFERDLLRMPEHISSITAWQLSRVDAALGPQRWTHVFEQEFTDHGAVTGQYLNHPIHWSVVDRWFDPECTDIIVRDRVCHTFCELDDLVIPDR